MGLNMDVDHVAFAADRKFDGRFPRKLTAPELAQIAGRAGRHMNDGTFGVTADLQEIEPELVEAIEAHEFDSVKGLYWRNRDLSFNSIRDLQMSLEERPTRLGKPVAHARGRRVGEIAGATPPALGCLPNSRFP